MKDKFFYYYSNLLVGFIAAAVVYWSYISYVLQTQDENLYNVFGFLLALLPLGGAILGFYVQSQWGGFSSVVGKSLFCISAALLMWFAGQSIYLFYSLTAQEVPYPGLPDIFFVLLDPLYALSLFWIVKYSGARHQARSSSFAYFLFLVVPIVFTILNFKVFFEGLSLSSLDFAGFFDLLYTFGSILVTTFVVLTLVLSVKKLGGKFKTAVYLFFLGFIFQYLGDVFYSLLERQEDFVLNGNFADLLFFLSIASITLGLAKFNTGIVSLSKGDDFQNDTK